MSATVDRRLRLGSRPLGAVGLILVAGYCVLLTYLMSRSTFDAWGALLVAPVLVMAAVPLLYRQAIREGDLGLFALLVWALVLRLAASMVGYYIAFGVYGGVADAHRYLDDGAAIADNFRHLIFSPGLGRWTDTSLPTLLVGTVQTLIGPTSLGTYLVFSWIGFWGLFLFYRAFTIGVPEGSRSFIHASRVLPPVTAVLAIGCRQGGVDGVSDSGSLLSAAPAFLCTGSERGSSRSCWESPRAPSFDRTSPPCLRSPSSRGTSCDPRHPSIGKRPCSSRH